MKSPSAVAISSIIIILGGVALGVIHFNGGSPGDPEGSLAATAFAAPVVTAGVLAVLGAWRGFPAITAASGLALIPIFLVSFVMLPLLLPAAVLVVYGLSAGAGRAPFELPASFIVGFGLLGAFIVLFVHQDPVSWSTADGSGSSSDIITRLEALVSLSILAAVSAAAMLIPRPRWRSGR